MKKILILVGDCLEDSQIDFPQKTSLTLGHILDVASPNKKPDDIITASIFEPSDLQYFNPGLWYKYKVTVDINNVNYKSYDALYLPGGHSPLHLHVNPKVIEITKYFLEYQKTLVSIWYSIFILAVTKSISGRKLTELPFTRVVADLAGAKYEETLCVKDGSLITVVGNPGLIKMMEEIWKSLK